MSKKLLSLILFAMFLSFPVASKAEEKITENGEQIIKDVSVKIPDNYTECTFTLQYENDKYAPDNVELLSFSSGLIDEKLPCHSSCSSSKSSSSKSPSSKSSSSKSPS